VSGERPSLAALDRRLALLEQSREHDAAHDQTVLDAVRDLVQKVETLRDHVDAKFVAVETKHSALDKVVGETRTLVRGFGAGWAAAFMFIGGMIGLGVNNITELFK
jgi:hypothetical protein